MQQYPRWLYSQSQPQGVIVATPELAETLPADDWYDNPNRLGDPIVASQAAAHIETAVLVTAEGAIPVEVKIDKRTKAFRETQGV